MNTAVRSDPRLHSGAEQVLQAVVRPVRARPTQALVRAAGPSVTVRPSYPLTRMPACTVPAPVHSVAAAQAAMVSALQTCPAEPVPVSATLRVAEVARSGNAWVRKAPPDWLDPFTPRGQASFADSELGADVRGVELHLSPVLNEVSAATAAVLAGYPGHIVVRRLNENSWVPMAAHELLNLADSSAQYRVAHVVIYS